MVKGTHVSAYVLIMEDVEGTQVYMDIYVTQCEIRFKYSNTTKTIRAINSKGNPDPTNMLMTYNHLSLSL